MRSPGKALPIGRLKRRADFVRAGKGRRWHGKAVSLQAGRCEDLEAPDTPPRCGFTLTKKVGCAVIRNRARRRLKEAVRSMPDLPVRPAHDYVFVGRLEAIRMPFEDLKRELSHAVDAVHEAGPRGADRSGSRKNRVKS